MRQLLIAVLVSAVASSTGVHAQAARLTLADALARGRDRSPARAAATARLDAADIAASTTPRFTNPLVEWRLENFAAGAPAGLPLDIFATATQAIEIGGERAARRGRAAAARDAARADVALTVSDVDLLIARHFVEAVRLRESAQTLDGQEQELEVLVRTLQRRVDEGVAAEADLRRLETERTRAHIEHTRAALNARRALAALNVLLAPGPAIPLEALEAPVAPPTPAPEDAAITAVRDRRPDVARAEARVAAARHALDFERARRVPDVTVTGGWKRTSGYGTGVLGVAVPVPIFDGGRAAAALAAGELRAAEAELAQAVALADADVRTALDAARTLRAEAERTRAALVEPASVARAAARAAFESGAMDVLRFVDAERVYTEAALMLHQLSSDAVLAAVAARLALAESPWP